MRIKLSEFGVRHLAISSVWTWSQDPFEDEDLLVPVPLVEEELLGSGSLLIHASIRTRTERVFEGVIIYDVADGEVFAIMIMTDDDTYTINKYAVDLSRSQLNRLAADQGLDSNLLLPISYELKCKELAIEPGTFSLQHSK